MNTSTVYSRPTVLAFRHSSRSVSTVLVCLSKLLLVRGLCALEVANWCCEIGNLKRELAHALESEDEASDPESSEQGQQTSSESERMLLMGFVGW